MADSEPLQSALTSALTESACELHKNVNYPAISALVTKALEAVLGLKKPQLVQVLQVVLSANSQADFLPDAGLKSCIWPDTHLCNAESCTQGPLYCSGLYCGSFCLAYLGSCDLHTRVQYDRI